MRIEISFVDYDDYDDGIELDVVPSGFDWPIIEEDATEVESLRKQFAEVMSPYGVIEGGKAVVKWKTTKEQTNVQSANSQWYRTGFNHQETETSYTKEVNVKHFYVEFQSLEELGSFVAKFGDKLEVYVTGGKMKFHYSINAKW